MRISKDIEEWVALKYGKLADEISSAHNQQIKTFERLMPRGGERDRAVMNEQIQKVKELVNIKAEILIEGFRRENTIPDENDLREIRAVLEEITRGASRGEVRLMGQEGAEELRGIVAVACRDLRIKTKEMQLEQSKARNQGAGLSEPAGERFSPVGHSTMDFSFVCNSGIKGILERDYAELMRLDPVHSSKSVLILSGGIIEGLLIDALVAEGAFTYEEAETKHLKELIHPAKRDGIIKHDNITDVLRVYRNLVHPTREIKEKLSFSVDHAIVARDSVGLIIREVREWSASRK
jgi:hypothetical protein